jgi:hypothetical protein
MDFVSYDLMQELGLQPCVQKKHQHVLPEVQAAGLLTPKIYGIYHPKVGITDHHG